MRYLSGNMILSAIVIMAVTIAGCARTTDNGFPAATSPVGAAVTSVTPAASQPDLTNQNSPLAAVFRDGATYTSFAPGQPRIGLKKISGDLSRLVSGW